MQTGNVLTVGPQADAKRNGMNEQEIERGEREWRWIGVEGTVLEVGERREIRSRLTQVKVIVHQIECPEMCERALVRCQHPALPLPTRKQA